MQKYCKIHKRYLKYCKNPQKNTVKYTKYCKKYSQCQLGGFLYNKSSEILSPFDLSLRVYLPKHQNSSL